MHILVIDDNQRLTRNIQAYLQTEQHYIVDVVFDGDEGLKKAGTGQYDCIVLDIMLPGMDGFAICAALRKQGVVTPILMLTALADDSSAIAGLDAGADDYLKKPFPMLELCARIRALLRRGTTPADPVLSSGLVSLNPNTGAVHCQKKAVKLAPKEYALLEFLLRNKGRVQDRKAIVKHVWGEYEYLLFSQTIDVHVAYLRKKLDHKLIKTVPGKGYMIATA